MRTLLMGIVLCAALAGGCADDEEEGAAAPAPDPVAALAQREAELEQDPYDLRCADLADEVASARMSRKVQYALADDARIPRFSRLRASQSIYYAITEICKGKPGSYKPARPAVAAVRNGKYVADLGAP